MSTYTCTHTSHGQALHIDLFIVSDISWNVEQTQHTPDWVHRSLSCFTGNAPPPFANQIISCSPTVHNTELSVQGSKQTTNLCKQMNSIETLSACLNSDVS